MPLGPTLAPFDAAYKNGSCAPVLGQHSVSVPAELLVSAAAVTFPHAGPLQSVDAQLAADEDGLLPTRAVKTEAAQRAFDLGYTCSDPVEVLT